MLQKHLPTIREVRQEKRGVRYEGETCPYCNKGRLIEQTGKYGSFIGCNRFPHCAGVGKRREDEVKVRSGGATIQKRSTILGTILNKQL